MRSRREVRYLDLVSSEFVLNLVVALMGVAWFVVQLRVLLS